MERNMAPITVRQLNLYVKSLLENDPKLSICSVCGEITNFKRHYASGHLYFTLSDGFAAIKCVMFKSNAIRCKTDLKDGMKVIVTGRVSIYEKDGGYQLYAEAVSEEGLGDKLLALKILKEKLAAEGLFDPESKRKIPPLPQRIAIITSGTGAALQDILNIISRRFPLCEAVLCSASVQGQFAAEELIAALDRVYSVADYIDTVIIGRGGGSSEDLDAFNDEALARKIYASPIPVISAVGHETDVTVCDMVADLRAPTPSAAAELAVPDREEFVSHINGITDKCRVSIMRRTELFDAKLSGILSRSVLTHQERMLEEKALSVDKCVDMISSLTKAKLERDALCFSGIVSKIDSLSPIKTIARGYAFASVSGKPLTSAAQVQTGDNINLRLCDGNLSCTVISKENL